MNEIETKKSVINYLVSDLGYPRSSVRENVKFSFVDTIPDLVIILEGEIKVVVMFSLYMEGGNYDRTCDQAALFVGHFDYFLITNGVGYHWFKNEDGLLKPSISPLLPSFFLDTEIKVIQDKLFDYLEFLYENSNLLFLFSGNRSAYEKGFWFRGSDFHCMISFWEGEDWVNKTDNIFLTFNTMGSVHLTFVALDSEVKAKFFKKIADVLGGFKRSKKNGKFINYWTKQYFDEWEEGYLSFIDEFLSKDKQIIDTFIQNELSVKKSKLGINFIKEKEFERNLNLLLKYRNAANVFSNNGESKEKNIANLPIIPSLLTLKNIGHFKNLEIDLGARVICLYGENGIGKTTILRAFLLGLTGADETSIVDLLNIKLQRLLRIESEQNGEISFAEQGSIVLDYFMDEPYQNKVVLAFKKGRRLVNIHDVYSDEKKSFGATDKNFYKNLIVGYSQVQGKNKMNKDDILYHLTREPHVYDVLPLLNDEVDDRFDQLSDWLIGLEGDAQKKGAGSSERKVRDIVFEVISHITETTIKFKDVNHKDRLLWVAIGENQTILFSLLSQGYKNLFSWVGHFIRRLAESKEYSLDFEEAPAIILIDEIATYLHPKWQRNILNVLAEKFRNARFIVTTHSPLVASHLTVESKALYIINTDGSVRKEEHIYGRNLKSIFYDWMGVPSRPAKMEKDIDHLFFLIDEETDESMDKAVKLMGELQKDLGEDDFDMMQAKNLIDLYKG